MLPLDLLVILVYLLVVVYAGIGDPGGHVTFVHDNSSLRYSDFTYERTCASNASLEPCRNKWWIQDGQGEFAAIVRGTHSTAGPSASMSFTFTGSTVVWLRGLRDPDVEVLSTINGAPVQRDTPSVPATFQILIDGLDPTAVNTFAISYAGSGVLSVVVLFLDANGRAAPQPEDPTTTTRSESSSTSTPASDLTSDSTLSSPTNVITSSPTDSEITSVPSHSTPQSGADSITPAARGSGAHVTLIVSILAAVLGALLIAAVVFFWRWRRRRQPDPAFTPLELHPPRDLEATVPAAQRRSKPLPLRTGQLQAVDMAPPSYTSITATSNSTGPFSDS